MKPQADRRSEKSLTDLRLHSTEASEIRRQVARPISDVNLALHEGAGDAVHHGDVSIVYIPGKTLCDLSMHSRLRVEDITMLVADGVDQIDTPVRHPIIEYCGMIVFVLRKRDLDRIAPRNEGILTQQVVEIFLARFAPTPAEERCIKDDGIVALVT